MESTYALDIPSASNPKTAIKSDSVETARKADSVETARKSDSVETARKIDSVATARKSDSVETAKLLSSSVPPSADLNTARKVDHEENALEFEECPKTARTLGSSAPKDQFRLKCVVVGEPLVGKTSLIYSFINKASIEPQDCRLLLPGMLSVCEKKVMFDRNQYTLMLYDTDYNTENRIDQYVHADIIILCYSVADINSLRQIEAKWIPELHEHAPGKPYVLVGCKFDLCDGAQRSMIVDEFAGVKMSTLIDSQAFAECSAKTLENIDRLFEEVCACVERHRLYTALAELGSVRSPYPSLSDLVTSCRPFITLQSLVPLAKQSYQSVLSCIPSPGAIIDRKKIESYIPSLKSWIPRGENRPKAREFPIPSRNAQPNRLMQGVGNEDVHGKQNKEAGH